MSELTPIGQLGAGSELDRPDPLLQFTEKWLTNRRFSGNTRLAYRNDVRSWAAWCEENGVDPLTAHFTDVNEWGRWLEREGGRGGKPLAGSTVARRMAAVSSWYDYLVKLNACPANPAATSDRPEVDRDFSPTVSFTREDAVKMLDAADDEDDIGPVGFVLASWLIDVGTRATETCLIDVSDLGYDNGYRVVSVTGMKGGRKRHRTVPPHLAMLLDRYLDGRASARGVSVDELDGPLFAGKDGERLTRHHVYRFVRRLAKRADVRNWDKITPHSFRHAWNAMARDAGSDMESRQFALGHRDPRTTRRYDQRGFATAGDPSMRVAAAIAEQRVKEG